ncbi:hypothetical protein J6590_009361 [Homalodisca vitripennis]|nr:hypothetical protein J6590_009361 [Homalodisca vitripennis]
MQFMFTANIVGLVSLVNLLPVKAVPPGEDADEEGGSSILLLCYKGRPTPTETGDRHLKASAG